MKEKNMATFATAPSTCTIQLNLFSGGRAPLPAGTEVLVTLRDGNQNVVNLPGNGFFKASTINITGLPFANGLADSYTVVASSKGLAQAGFTPVPINPQRTAIVDLMLIPKDASFNFHGAKWSLLQQNHPAYADLLRAGAA